MTAAGDAAEAEMHLAIARLAEGATSPDELLVLACVYEKLRGDSDDDPEEAAAEERERPYISTESATLLEQRDPEAGDRRPGFTPRNLPRAPFTRSGWGSWL